MIQKKKTNNQKNNIRMNKLNQKNLKANQKLRNKILKN